MSEQRTSNCGRCGRPLKWCRSVNGNGIPLDPEPNILGNIVCQYEDGKLIGRVISKEEPRPPGVTYMTHFATCPVMNRQRDTKKSRHLKVVKPEPEQPPSLFDQPQGEPDD